MREWDSIYPGKLSSVLFLSVILFKEGSLPFIRKCNVSNPSLSSTTGPLLSVPTSTVSHFFFPSINIDEDIVHEDGSLLVIDNDSLIVLIL